MPPKTYLESPDPYTLEESIRSAFPVLWEMLFNRDVYLIGGSAKADNIKFSEEEKQSKIFVQLNHHLTRRHHHPCDWLIARAGSTMNPTLFKTLPEKLQKQIKVVSCACNKNTFKDWLNAGFLVYPFHEVGYSKANPYHPALEWCNQFWNEIRTNPLVGMIAVKMILMFPVKSLTLKGFDFYRLSNGCTLAQVACHEIPIQKRWLRHLYLTDFRINLEDSLVNQLKIEGFYRGISKLYEI
jgi:hypothetical protein